jgi:hypothetical protein
MTGRQRAIHVGGVIAVVATRGAEPLGTAEAAIVFAGIALFLIVPSGLWIGRHRVVLDDTGIHTLRGTKTTRSVAWSDIELAERQELFAVKHCQDR